MLSTSCQSCGHMTPLRVHNSPRYWYCKFCKANILPRPLARLTRDKDVPKDILEKIKTSFQKTSHYIAVCGDIQIGGPVVIKIPTLAKVKDQIPSRPSTKSLALFSLDLENDFQLLGEVFF